jgi:NAD(P)H-dependent flavin oxidoreductase YrpB (nitropropane dioxygenase family)
MLGIRYPIVQGGMMWVGRAELASAVSNGGGLGILTGLTQPTPEDLQKEIARCRSMTDKPFGVNIISIEGFECAGHPGEDDVPGLVLIPAAVRALNIPVIASGGIADGRGLAAALTLGAQGVNMGTRFMTTREAPIHDNIKKALIAGSETDTRHLYRTMNNTARYLNNDIVKEVRAMEYRPGGCKFEEIRHLVAGVRGREAYQTGDINHAPIPAGLVIGLIDDMPTCAELISRMVAECRTQLKTALAWTEA